MMAWIDTGCYAMGAALLGLGLFLKCRRQTAGRRLYALSLGAAFLFLFFTTGKIHPAPVTLVALAVMTLGGFLAAGGRTLEKYRSRGGCLGILAVSAYGSFASFFQRFFLEENARIPLSWPGIFYCLAGMVWFTGIAALGLYLLEAGRQWAGRCRQTAPDSRRRVFRTIFGVLALCQMGILLAHWPGMVALDTTDHLTQIATGVYHDAHNVMQTLLLQLILGTIPNVAAAAALQQLLFAWLLAAILMLGYERGISVWKLCAGGCLFLLLPNQAITQVSLLKDVPFSVAMLWAAYLLAMLALEKPWTKKWSYWAAVALDMLLLAGVRHNGIGVMLVMLCLFAWLTIRRFSMVRFRALAASLLAVVLFAAYKGPLFALLHVAPNDQSAATSLLCAAGGYLNKGLALSEESAGILERVMPLEDWADYYDRYVGHDVYRWERPEGSVPYTPENITLAEAAQVYLEVLRKAPDVALHDRLSGMDILWNVRMARDAFNLRTIDFVYVTEQTAPYVPTAGLEDAGGGVFYNRSLPARAYQALIHLTPENSMLDMLLWRTGVYLIVFGILLVFWRINRMRRMLWASLPMLVNVLVLAVGMFHQSFRYVYFAQLSVVFLVYLTVIQADALADRWEK